MNVGYDFYYCIDCDRPRYRQDGYRECYLCDTDNFICKFCMENAIELDGGDVIYVCHNCKPQKQIKKKVIVYEENKNYSRDVHNFHVKLREKRNMPKTEES